MPSSFPAFINQRFWALILIFLGFLLSPACWWNDLLINLPLAYVFGRFCSWFIPQLLLPGVILGYWFSNLVGIVLMHIGAQQAFQKGNQNVSLQDQIKSGLITSTTFTLVILSLAYFQVVDLSNYIPSELFAVEPVS
ncbi:hypothetical protein [Synechocystis sp. LKSZ1]|uniref:hypothetical protein n=1 Tax=Synechocystis sp. LKSZ1 TaxID=3144951 RepID=UPI00336C0F81